MVANTSFPDIHPSGAPYGQMDPSRCKEQFSIAYAHAIATAARCKLENIIVDDESVDATIKQVAEHSQICYPALDIQLKCTSQEIEKSDGDFSWKLSAKNYNELSTTKRGSIILIVLRVPVAFTEWAPHTEDNLTLVRAAHWVNLRGQPAIPAGSSRVVTIPRQNHFSVEQLLGIMKRVGDGGFP